VASLEEYRAYLKGDLWGQWEDLDTDQKNGISPPPQQKPHPDGAALIDLEPPEALSIGRVPLMDVLAQRRSRRKYSPDPLTLDELSFLLWATQGLSGGSPNRRTAPSAGARHPFETYLVVDRVTDVEPGLYRYLALGHQLLQLSGDPGIAEKAASADLEFCARGAVIFVWTAIPYRTEWRYSIISHKMIALDAGHVCQNLYLACEAIGAGTCGIGAYNHTKVDALIGVDGKEEFTVYLAPVGKVS